jgi:hypothetical protein
MSRLARSCRALVVGLAAAAAMLSTTQVASAAAPEPTVDPAIAVPPGNKVFLVGHATGKQIYACTSGGTWDTTKPTPQATLVDDNGKVVATHFAGPTWQHATDGSTVVGANKIGVNAPDPNTAIQWLRLSAARTALGPHGGDELAKTTYIQRVNTDGGVAPKTSCTGTDTIGVPYKADYYFWMASK